LLSPTVIETAAYDFYRLAPDGVSMCAITSNIEQSASGAAGESRSLPQPHNPLILLNHAQCIDRKREQQEAGRTCPGPAQSDNGQPWLMRIRGKQSIRSNESWGCAISLTTLPLETLSTSLCQFRCRVNLVPGVSTFRFG
jgi:hypothetical protein